LLKSMQEPCTIIIGGLSTNLRFNDLQDEMGLF
jgi:hypothetical protein